MDARAPSEPPDPALALVDLHETAFACLRAIRRIALQKRLHVCHEVTMPAPMIAADERRIVDSLVELLMIAVRAAPEDGHVGISIETPANDVLDDVVVLTVWTSGCVGRDEGAALARAQRLVEGMGGCLHVSREADGPTRFVTAIRSRSREPLQGAREATGAARVLVVEDDEANVVTLLDYLTAHGFEVSVAEDGLHGLALARRTLPDAIIMDVNLPGLSGLDAMRAIRRDPSRAVRETPIFALTARALPDDREQCLAAGADEYWSKPATLRLLVAAIEQRVRGRREEPRASNAETW
jgi:CheY-like chemotaxis protein